MKPKKINTYHTDTLDIDKNEIGEYHPYKILYDKYPSKVGDLVILKVYPHFDDIMEEFKYEQIHNYPPEYLVLAEVIRFTDSGGFFCKAVMEEIESV